MMGYAKIGGGVPSSVGPMTDHLLNNTLTRALGDLAGYYARGAGTDEERQVNAMAELVADGSLRHDAALNELITEWLRQPGYDADRLEANKASLGLRLTNAVAAIRKDLAPEISIAILRPDIHPMVVRGLGLDVEDTLTRERLNGLLSGNRADGKPIEGKRYAVEHTLPPNPRTGERRESKPVGAYDFCPTPDKSVSVAWAFAAPVEQAQIFNAHLEAAREAVAYVAQEVGQARMGAGGEDGREPGHVAWIEFTHHTSRRITTAIHDGVVEFKRNDVIPGDPDLHTHFLMPNATFCPSGRVGSLDTKALEGFIFEADGYYHARLAQKLREAGFDVALDARTGAARMTAIPDDVRTLFSKRTNIGEALAKLNAQKRGEVWDNLSDEQQATRVKNATQDRNQKSRGDKDDVANVEDWQRQAKAAGWKAPASFRASERTLEIEHTLRIRKAYELALPYLATKFEQKAVLRHWDVRAAALRGLIETGIPNGLADVDAVTRLMREEGVLQYGERTALLWGKEADRRYVSVTTALHEAQEQEFLTLAKAAAQDWGAALPAKAIDAAARQSGLDFSTVHGQAQFAAVHRLGQGGRFGVVIGTAGAGKSAMLKVLTEAWKQDGRAIYGASLAWRQADDMVDGGIDPRNVKAFSVLLDGLGDGSIKLDRKTVLAVDELGLLGTRQGLALLRFQARDGFQLVALGDDKQCAAIEAGGIINLTRRALGSEQVPEILTTVRQQTERERAIVGLLRDGRPAEAISLKREDGTAEMVPGGRDHVVRRVAALYAERLQATGTAPTISTPTNMDAHQLGEAVRQERRQLGLIGPDLVTIPATDGERYYDLQLAQGDHVRLFRTLPAKLESGKGGRIGRNGSVAEILRINDVGITMRAVKNDLVGQVRWSDLADKTDGRATLAYGTALTIHTAQGLTSNEHIFAMPSGSMAATGLSAYVASTRHRISAYLITSDMAERQEVRSRRLLNDGREITLDDRWANVARNFANQPVKDLALSLIDRAEAIRRGAIKSFHAGMHPAEQRFRRGEALSHASEKGARKRVQQGPMLQQIAGLARDLTQQVVIQAREVARHARDVGNGWGLFR